MTLALWHGNIFRTRHPAIPKGTIVCVIIFLSIALFERHKKEVEVSSVSEEHAEDAYLRPGHRQGQGRVGGTSRAPEDAGGGGTGRGGEAEVSEHEGTFPNGDLDADEGKSVSVKVKWSETAGKSSTISETGSETGSEPGGAGALGDDSLMGDGAKMEDKVTTKVKISEQQSQGKGYPRVVILWTTWRSGSTFLGDLLVSAVSETFYSYEPLIPYGVRILRSNDTVTNDALAYLSGLFRCNLTNYKWQLRRMARERCYRRRNTYLMTRCVSPKVDCGNTVVVSDICKSAKLHFAKVLRMGLVWAEKLLEDPSLDVQIVYMVRDPRPVMRSRRPYGWCKSDCRNVTNVCHHLRFDLQDSCQLARRYPDRFKFVQYEQLSLDTEKHVRDIWNFLRFDMTEEVTKKLQKLTSKSGPTGAFDTSRDTTAHTFSWRLKMGFSMVAQIQKACGDVIRQLGLRSFSGATELRNMSISALLSKPEEEEEDSS
ncbi:carbohydrate sulfotransferase 5-like [Macrobrachium nipponense]|uniref:carbohydrate sulfotransferase 5-like n=1 Tax=Macrobrachium nipponense TaxID=159736 RepID=UPI0030C84FA2